MHNRREQNSTEAPLISEEDLNSVFETKEGIRRPFLKRKELSELIPAKNKENFRGTQLTYKKEIRGPKKLALYLGIIVGLLFITGVIYLALNFQQIFQQTTQNNLGGNGNYSDEYLQSLYATGEGKPVCPEEFECCNGINNQKKLCPGNQTCRNNKCELRECTSQCCVLEDFIRKECPQGLVCERYECVLPQCPYGCCEKNANYTDKLCENNMECVNNECRLRACNNECCVGKQGFEDKICPNNGICNNGTCEKPECPTRCCLGVDPLYKEKLCPSVSHCVGRVCVPNL
ncbi:MAG TPA: hypothetical protein VFF13_02540 [archaeon]|nr:hypothetical protein [archaeon]